MSQVYIDNCLWIKFYQSEQFIEYNMAVSPYIVILFSVKAA